ncbi:MAG: phosphatase PAP2 family protein [Candidatus Niyogibacteria bacterium]|nr:phosphatase PAP2 family protein [Candidatus Niyogibacteria bacterium]
MNLYLFNIIHGFSGKWLFLDWLGVFFAEYLGYFLILASFVLIFKKRDRQEQIYFFSFIFSSLILARGIITEAIKFFIAWPRPFFVLNFQPLIDANGINTSMPSGHAAFYFALAAAIFIFNVKASRWFFGAALLMGLARVFAGVHWPADILVGAAIGISSVFLVKYIFSAISPVFLKNSIDL